MIANNTNGNVLEVKRLLHHKAIASTMKYIGKIQFKKNEYETTSATSLDDILKLGANGWIEYSVVKMNGIEVHCFKKANVLTVIHRKLGFTFAMNGLSK
jgi:hypothetical protein